MTRYIHKCSGTEVLLRKRLLYTSRGCPREFTHYSEGIFWWGQHGILVKIMRERCSFTTIPMNSFNNLFSLQNIPVFVTKLKLSLLFTNDHKLRSVKISRSQKYSDMNRFLSLLKYPNKNPSAKQKLALFSWMGYKSIEIIILASLFLNGLKKYWDHKLCAPILKWASKISRS